MRRDLIVPRGKCPLDVLAKRGEKIRNTWIFLHVSVVLKLQADEAAIAGKSYNGDKLLIWEATEEHPETRIVYYNFETTDWYLLTDVLAEDIAFSATEDVGEPEEVIFVKMEGA